MKPVIEIIQTTPEHIRILADTLRNEDKTEIEAANMSCIKGCWKSYKNSIFRRTVLIDGIVAACFGCGGSVMGIQGNPWLLTSNEAVKISPLTFARIYKAEVHKMLNLFPLLVSYIHAEHRAALKLISLVGFKIGESERIGTGEFIRCEMRV